MLNHARLRGGAMALGTLVILASGAACVDRLSAVGALSFGLGWLVGRLGAPTVIETRCYRNGEPVDCSATGAPIGETIRPL